MPLLREGKALAPRPIFWHYPHYGNQGGTPGSAVRLGDFKLIRFFEGERIELYDVRNDLGEKHDLASDSPEKARELKKLMEDWLGGIKAGIPTLNPAFKGENMKVDR
jgi:arylsulfatase A-like enzyme